MGPMTIPIDAQMTADGMHRRLVCMAVPLILSNLTVPIVGAVGTAVIGHLDAPHYLASVALGSNTVNILIFVFGFLRMGTTGLTAQAVGAGDGDEVRACLGRAALLGLGITVLLWLASPLILSGAVAIYAPSEAVLPHFVDYVTIRLVGLPASLAMIVLLGWLLGLGDARAPLAMLLAACVVNTVLDVVFVLGFGWAVRAVAVAAILGELAAVTVGLVLARGHLRRLGGRWDTRALFDRIGLLRALGVNRDIFLRALLIEAAFIGLLALSSRQGDAVLAANAILLNFQMAAAYGLDGFAHATESLVGRSVGARNRVVFRAVVRAGLHCSLAVALIMTAMFALGGSGAIGLMTDIETVRAAAFDVLPYIVLSPLISVWAFLMDGVFIGATRTAAMRNAMAVCLLSFVLGAAVLVPALGNHGVWLTFLIFMAMRGLSLAVVYVWIERRAGFIVPAAARS